mgnify:CR=1 FL=1
MNYYNNDILKFINYLNNERTNIKEILKSLEILEYHLKNRTYNLTTYIKPIMNIFTREEYALIIRYNYQEVMSRKRTEYTNKLAMIESLINKLDKKEALDEYIKADEFLSLLRESNLSTEEQARVIYQINCINIPIIEKVIAKKESLRTNISESREELSKLVTRAIDIYSNLKQMLDMSYLNSDRIFATMQSLLESLSDEIDFAKYALLSNTKLNKVKEMSQTDSLLRESIDTINLILNNLSELTSNLPNKSEPKEEQESENKIIYLTDEDNIPFINCGSKDSIELISELRKGLTSNSKGIRYVKGIDSIEDNIYVRTKQKEGTPSVSFIKVNNFIIVIAIDKLDDIYKETMRVCNKYSNKISSIKAQLSSLPLPLLHESDLIEESIMEKSGKRGK